MFTTESVVPSMSVLAAACLALGADCAALMPTAAMPARMNAASAPSRQLLPLRFIDPPLRSNERSWAIRRRRGRRIGPREESRGPLPRRIHPCPHVLLGRTPYLTETK